MSLSIFFIPLAIGVLLLLGFTLKKLISGFLIERKINPAYSKLFALALLGIWFFFSIYLLLDAVLGHSEVAKKSLQVEMPARFLLNCHTAERYSVSVA